MKIPSSVLETSFSEVIATVKSVPTLAVVSKVTPTVSTPTSPSGSKIKPQYILIGIGIIVGILIIIHLVQKNRNSSNRVSY
jgi:hypothetical protein